MPIKHKPTVSLELVTKEGASRDKEANGGAEAGKWAGSEMYQLSS